MRIINKFLLISGAILLVKCSSLPKPPAEPEFAAAQKKWTDAKMEDLTAGHLIYTTKCNKCHGLKKMASYNQETWTKIIDVMGPKAKLNDSETDQLRKYIYSARETVPVK